MSYVKSEQTHILIVDDTQSNIELLKALLEEAGYHTSEAATGIEAIEMVAKDRPDMILLDVIMPGIDGFETCRRLKAHASSEAIPIIFVTSLSQQEHIQKGFEVGAIDYILKPLQDLEVLARVTNQVRALERQQLLKINLLKTEKMAGLGRLVSSIAHEVSTPIGSLRMAVGSLNEGVKQTLDVLNSGALKKADLLRFLNLSSEAIDIAMSNVESTNSILNSFKEVAIDQCSNRVFEIDLRSYLEAVLLSLRPSLKRLDHTIKIKIPYGVLMTIQPGALSQIIINLINNSILHGFEGIDIGEIRMSHEIKGDRLHLAYSDNGNGMEPHHLQRIFDEYYTTKAGEGGNGLGMSIVKQLVESELSGNITVNSAVNRGIKVEISLPL